jgi:hypothetical protein
MDCKGVGFFGKKGIARPQQRCFATESTETLRKIKSSNFSVNSVAIFWKALKRKNETTLGTHHT